MMARLYALRRRLARAICPEQDPRYAFELGKFAGQMGDNVPLVIPHPDTLRPIPLTADFFGPRKRQRTAADSAKSYGLTPGKQRYRFKVPESPAAPAAPRGRFQAQSWWILPGTFVGVWMWIGFFKLIGVL